MRSWLPIARSASAVAALLATATGCGFLRSSKLPDLGPVPAFQLQSEAGAAFDSRVQLADKVWVADFIFTNCPGPCPRMTQHMRWLQDNTQGLDAVRFVSFTVDPERDTPAVLKEYAQKFHAEAARWTFLTGSPAELRRLSKNVFKLGDIAPDFEHSTRFVLVDKQGRLRGYFGTTEPSFRVKLLEAIKDLARE